MKLFKKLLRDEWGKFVTFTCVLILVAVLQTFFWPTLEKLVPALLENLPEPVRWIAGGMAENGFMFFTITQHFLKNIGLFGAFFAIMLAASAMAREFENGTMEFLLAHPISRLRVVSEKFIFGAVALAIPVFLSTLAIAPAALLVVEIEVSVINLLLGSIYGFSIILVFYSFTFCLGIFIGEQMKTISISLILLIFQFSLTVLEQTRSFTLLGWLDNRYLMPLMTKGVFPAIETAAFLSISAALFIVSSWQFRRMNI
jgi:ABC-2 type transport system permease protein